MDVIQKWRFGGVLELEEASIVIQELFNNSRKKYNFNSVKPININIFSLFKSFKENKNGEFTITFSNEFEDGKVCVTLEEAERLPSHTIKTTIGDIFIYE